jgi:hypothetical protein
MDLEETEARNDCPGEGQQQSNQKTDFLAVEKVKRFIGKISMRLAASGAPVAVKRRAVNRSTKLKNSLYIYIYIYTHTYI